MAGTDLEVQSGSAITILEGSDFAQRVKPLLPDTLPLARFVGVAKTAIRSRPELAGGDIDQRSLFNALIACAQMGLVPDGKKAALNVYRSKEKQPDGSERMIKKVQLLPMVEGVRDVGSDYGWMIRAEAVYAADEFDVVDEPPALMHKRPRPGVDRGELVATYAIAIKDGVRYQVVLYADDVKKRRAKAKTQNFWNDWPEAMWRKSAVHALFRVLPKSEVDRMERLRVLANPVDDADDAVERLYGPNGTVFREIAAAPTSSAEPSSPGSDGGGDRQQATSAPGQDADVVPGEDEEPTMPLGETVETAETDEEELRAAAEVVADTKIPNGLYEGVTLREVAAIGEDGHGWIDWALSHPGKFEGDFHAALETFVQGYLPDLWEQHTQRQAA